MTSTQHVKNKFSKFGSEGALGAVDIMQSGQNKRIDPRKQVQWKVIVQLKSKAVFQTTTVNISRSGVMIKSPKNFDVGERAYVKIYARHGIVSKVIDAVIEVKHTVFSKGGYLAGGLFLKTPDGTKEFIDAFVNNAKHITNLSPDEADVEVDDENDQVIKKGSEEIIKAM